MASYISGLFSNTLPRLGRYLRTGSDSRDSGTAGRPQVSSPPSTAPLTRSMAHDLSRLHHTKNVKGLIDILTRAHLSDHINEIDVTSGRAPIHSIIHRSSGDRKLSLNLLSALLTYSDADVNLFDRQGRTPLHIAVEMDSVECAKVLLAFGANPNLHDREERTALDVATTHRRPVYLKSVVQKQSSNLSWTYVCTENDQQSHSLEDVEKGTLYSEVGQLLVSVGARHSDCSTTPEAVRKTLIKGEDDDIFPGGFDSDVEDDKSGEGIDGGGEGVDGGGEGVGGGGGEGCGEVEGRRGAREMCGGEGGRREEGEACVRRKPQQRRKELNKVLSGGDLTGLHPLLIAWERRHNYNVGGATRKLYREMEDNMNQRTNSMMSLGSLDEMLGIQMQRKQNARYRATGARILCLDGGGMKGLVELDVLEQLELETGQKIPELFDWIVATSTGAIIILGLLYAKKSLKEIRQLYYRLKDDVFASPRFGLSYNTAALEGLLIDIFGTEMTLEYDKKNMPKVIITAVNKKNKNPEIQYFSNCLGDNLCKTPVWKVARCASAAPMFFSEFEDHVDGGVLANNPCQVGLTKIENHHWERQEKLPISVVVSVGSGIYPPEKLGSVNAQQCLYFGAHWLRLKDTLHEIRNLAELLSNALVESEMVAHTSEMQCRERGIAFYRVSPALDDIIAASETSNEKLCHMVVCTRVRCKGQITEIARTLVHGPEKK